MNEQRLQIVEELFSALVDLDAAARERLLESRCAGDESLKREVMSLLEHHVSSEAFLDSKELRGVVIDQPPEASLPTGTRVADYTILGILGEGGMGVVYLAQQERPRRTVALKLIRASLASSPHLRRFEHEAEILGLLQHPGIAQIFEAGSAQTAQGVRAFIAMELVEGEPLTWFARKGSLSTRDRLELVAKVCDAVHHAHQRGVIHRDIKPGNVLVDKSGQPKVLDFGVSRALAVEGDLTTLQTSAGQIIGTLAYMSPEQASGAAQDVDVRADVYALGVVLYELLADRLPFDIASKPLPEAARIIHDQDPSRLSVHSKEFRGDIEVIVAKAMEKDKARRYQSAAQLGEDIRRHLTGAPIAAKQDSAMYIARKLLRRHRYAALAAGAFVLAMATFLVYAIWQARVQTRLAADERQARLDADAARHAVDQQAEELRRNLYVSAIGYAQAAYAARDPDRMKRVLDSCPQDLRGWEWRYLQRTADTSLRRMPLPAEGLGTATPCPDGSRLVTWGGPGVPLQVFDAAQGNQIAEIRTGAQLNGALMDDAGSRIVFSSVDNALKVAEVATGNVRTLWAPNDGPVLRPLSVSSDGSMLLLATDDGKEHRDAVLVSLKDGSTVRDLGGPIGFAGSISPDGALAALAQEDGTLRLCSLAPGGAAEKTLSLHAPTPIRVTVFNHDGTMLATGGLDGMVAVYDTRTGQTRTIPVSDNKILALTWSPDGRFLAASGTEPVIRVIDPARSRIIATLFGHEARVDTLGWGSAGLSSSARDKTFRWWGPPERQAAPSRELDRSLQAGCVSAAGGPLFLGLNEGEVLAIDTRTLETQYELPSFGANILGIRASPDGSLLGVCIETGEVAIIDTATRRRVSTLSLSPARAVAVSFSPDARRVALAGETRSVSIWDPHTGERLSELPSSEEWVPTVTWSPDGSLIATADMKGVVRLHNAADGRVLRELRSHDNVVFHIRFTPDGRTLCTGDDLGVACVWDVASGKLLHRLIGHQHGIYGLDISPDGARLVTGGWDNTVRLWHIAEGRELLTLRGHTSGVYAVGFSSDGMDLLSVAANGSIHAWSAREPTKQ